MRKVPRIMVFQHGRIFDHDQVCTGATATMSTMTAAPVAPAKSLYAECNGNCGLESPKQTLTEEEDVADDFTHPITGNLERLLMVFQTTSTLKMDTINTKSGSAQSATSSSTRVIFQVKRQTKEQIKDLATAACDFSV